MISSEFERSLTCRVQKTYATSRCSIVAVHGLLENSANTWTYTIKSGLPSKSAWSRSRRPSSQPDDLERILWLRDFLPSDIPSARIMTFEYGFEGPGKLGSLNDAAHSLLHCVKDKRKEESVSSVSHLMINC